MLLRLLPIGEGGVGLHEVPDVPAAALDEVLGQAAAVVLVGRAGEVVGEVREGGIEQGEQGAEGVLLAGVGRGGDQDHVPVLILGQSGDEAVALVAGAAALAGLGAGVGLIDDHELRAGAEEVVAPADRI